MNRATGPDFEHLLYTCAGAFSSKKSSSRVARRRTRKFVNSSSVFLFFATYIARIFFQSSSGDLPGMAGVFKVTVTACACLEDLCNRGRLWEDPGLTGMTRKRTTTTTAASTTARSSTAGGMTPIGAPSKTTGGGGGGMGSGGTTAGQSVFTGHVQNNSWTCKASFGTCDIC